MMLGLSVPDGAIARGLDRPRRERRVSGLRLLQANDVRARFLQPFDQSRKAALDAIDVEACDLQVNLFARTLGCFGSMAASRSIAELGDLAGHVQAFVDVHSGA